MNSLIHFSQSPVSVAHEGLSSTSRVHASLLNHGSLSVSQWCKRSQLVSRPLYVRCTLERFSEGPKMKEENGKKKMKNNIMRRVGKASLVMACVLGAFTLSGKMNLKPNIAYAEWLSKPSMEKSSSKTEGPSPRELEAPELREKVESMKKEFGYLAEKIISEECERVKDTATASSLQVLLIELLVDQRKYLEARKEIKKLLDDGPVDVPLAKVYLLKAIAESENDPKEATESWKRYLRELAPSSPYSVKLT